MNQSSVTDTRLARGEGTTSWSPSAKPPYLGLFREYFHHCPALTTLTPTEKTAHQCPLQGWRFLKVLKAHNPSFRDRTLVFLVPHHCFQPNLFPSSTPSPARLQVLWPCTHPPCTTTRLLMILQLCSFYLLTYSLSNLSCALPWGNSRTVIITVFNYQ